MSKKVKLIVLAIIVALLVIVAGAVYVYISGVKAPSSKNDEVTVEISGSNTAILNQLDEAGLLKNKTVASIYLKMNSYTFQANTYILNKNMDLETICKAIEGKDNKYILQNKVTVIEGTTIPEYATVVANALDISQEEVLQKWCDKEYLQSLVDTYWFLDESILKDGLLFPLEGYLAPQTYFVTDGNATVEGITKIMLDQMDSNLSQYKDKIENFTINNKKVPLHEFLALCSVVESESLYKEDYTKIAGVFMHRLEIGMMLQSDVTVNYANQVTKVAVTYDDLAVDSKYNTYKYKGLPAGPISSVSNAIIEGCLNYEKTDNEFFFAIKGGEVIYSKTYKEHSQKIQEYKDKGLWLED